ncbi:transcriptional regulator with XRE-family HTH domain [Saccharopolyspora lacisalsi]|uniref:Transcriptional regulator with XRE-family HTH domain n=1 Tax=Halosaccharopolyspora lacisalsi TaxID=1000566 RepID=A0A839E0H9_9PSEU|nr:helix-turn-helix transcriptional regulator [Halosaccharopolyspora lacisalsi]MBA8827254.1 transcriptional regulator with XRE-family HTH domain [Halosaccharopolyspora lacisalsi]
MRKSPTMHRRRLGSKLRELRERAGRTHREVAEWLDCSQGKISQIELGRVPVRASDVRLMAEFCGAAAEQVTSLEELARDSKQPGWWQGHPSTARRPGFDTYLGLETAAQAVSCFGADSVPELLRTVDYGRALLGNLDETDTADRLAVTSSRQQRLLGERPLELWAVLDEAVLRRVVGGPAVMRSQLEYLVLMSYRRNVTLRVLPFDADEHALSGDRVTVFSFSNPTDPQVVHLGDSTNSRFLDKPGETEPYLTSFDRVCAAALTTRDSANLISTIADGRNR